MTLQGSCPGVVVPRVVVPRVVVPRIVVPGIVVPGVVVLEPLNVVQHTFMTELCMIGLKGMNYTCFSTKM